jgi:hypothetical protein
LQNALKMHKRPDVSFRDNESEPSVFWLLQSVQEDVQWRHEAKWRERAGIPLLVQETIEHNLLKLLSTTPRWVLLDGTCSSMDRFLSRNQVKAICLVRHPVDAYVSLYGNQHPEFANLHGGLDSTRAITVWALGWRNIVSDFIESGNPICRYERLLDDCKDKDLLKAIRPRWRSGRRSHSGTLPLSKERLLLSETFDRRPEIAELYRDLP